MNSEQGDVETVRRVLLSYDRTIGNLTATSPTGAPEAIAALDWLAAALERAERERDNWHASNYAERQARQKAERALAEMQPVFDAALQLANAREREEDDRLDALFAAIARPSEGTGDES